VKNLNHFRRTKIIFTLGPSCDSREKLTALIKAGVDVCRINMAHAKHEWVSEKSALIRQISRKVNREIALMMDIKGPEIRTGPLENTCFLEEEELFDFTLEDAANDDSPYRQVSVNYPDLIADAEVGSEILVDNGLIHFLVEKKMDDRLRCRVLVAGPLGSRRHINLPGIHVKLPSITEKDRKDLQVAIENEFDYVALSFVRDAGAIEYLKGHLREHGSPAWVIAKIEDQQAIANLDDIITASDGLMIARGDLGIECPYEDLPIIQHQAVKTCINLGKPVIVATHMLESMIGNPVPTRAEVSDVAQAVLELSDCVMLSGETATGKYPLECVEVLKRIAAKMEEAHQGEPNRDIVLNTPKGKMLRSAAYLAHELDNCGIVVFTRSGFLAQRLSSLRPKSPLYAFTDQKVLFYQLIMQWGIEPFYIDFHENPESTIKEAFEYLLQKDWVKKGDCLIVITNVLAGEKIVDTTQIREVE